MAKSKEKSWYIDSGCSTHMTYNAGFFKEIKEDTEENKVVLGDNNIQEVKGKGVVSIKINTGETKNISDVFLILGLKMNLLSLGQMMEQDYKLEFDNGECLIKDKLNKGKVVAKGELTTDRLFKLVIPPQPYSVKIQGKGTFGTGTYRFMWTDENTVNGKSEILYDTYR
eukprot:Gb_37666 [translate_table: standard]